MYNVYKVVLIIQKWCGFPIQLSPLPWLKFVQNPEVGAYDLHPSLTVTLAIHTHILLAVAGQTIAIKMVVVAVRDRALISSAANGADNWTCSLSVVAPQPHHRTCTSFKISVGQ